MNKLLKLLKKRSKHAMFDEWIECYHGALYKHALWMLGSRDLAQEMTQEAFFQAWLGMDSLKDKNKALPWLLTILRRSVYREQRCQYRNQETLKLISQLEQPGANEDAFSLMEIYQSLAQLSPKLRDTFLLYHLHGFSYEEISAQLKVPIGTVMSRLSRAREELHKQQLQSATNIYEFNMHHRGSGHEGQQR
jgi:RNA polymerase sigma-70 factor, ECF subfamily